MAERVAFSKSIKLAWLNEVAGYAVTGLSRREAGERFNNTIEQSISNASNRKLTRIILLNTWYSAYPPVREKALSLFTQMGTEEKLMLHWALLLSEYSLFYDLCTIIGRFYAFRNTVTAQQIKAGIYEKWGERATLSSSIPKSIKTLKDLGAIKALEKPGVYTRVVRTVSSPHCIGLLLAAILRASHQSYITWDAFCNHPTLFPFHFENVNEGDLAALQLIDLVRIDGRAVLCLAEG